MKTAGYFLCAIGGAAIGAAFSWFFVKTYYERIAQEEIDSVKKTFKKYEENEERETVDDILSKRKKQKDSDDIIEYAKKLRENNYVNYSNSEKEKVNSEYPDPYVISPEEFGEAEYPQISLTYFSDGVLADEFDDKIDNVNDTVGIDSLKHFGEYEDDSVFVRNERLGIDYEILLDTRRFEDVLIAKPQIRRFYEEE